MNSKYPQITQITQISAKGIGRAAERKTSHKDIKRTLRDNGGTPLAAHGLQKQRGC
jgi:hypothetical protein